MKSLQFFLRRVFKNVLKYSLKHRHIVLEIDMLLCVLGFFSAVFVHSLGLGLRLNIDNFFILLTVFFISCLVSFLILKSYRGLSRHTNFMEMWRLYASLMIACVVLFVAVLATGEAIDHKSLFVMNVFLINLFLLLFMRYSMVLIYNFTVNYTNNKYTNAFVFGTDQHCIALAQWLNKSNSSQYHVKGFFSRNKNERKARIADLPVFFLNGEQPDWIMRKNEITTIIFPDYVTVKNEQAFIKKCVDAGLKVLVTPPFEGLDHGQTKRINIKPIQFEDLLGRDEIKINMERIAAQTTGKVVLVTGGAGSIGSELVRQLAHFNPALLVVFDAAETPLHHLRLELERNFPDLKFVPVIGNVRNKNRLEYVFRDYKPQIVYHAAAYKHVPLMEENPCEAILTNVQGTMLLSNMSLKNKVESFVMISTDKAVNPTNVMGASKRIAEIYIQSLARKNKLMSHSTRFVTTRFGNVLGSNGSVIPHFKEQIEKGGPVTVTHPEIIRYFMTIPEACRLVMEAASFGRSGEIYVFDMGSPVKIVDLARRMIELAGFVPGKDIDIEFTGLRPGEKLYEELLNDKETTLPTEHEKITIASVQNYDYEYVLSSIEYMIDQSVEVDIDKTVEAMKKLVPEFISQNSPFEKYDKAVAN